MCRAWLPRFALADVNRRRLALCIRGKVDSIGALERLWPELVGQCVCRAILGLKTQDARGLQVLEALALERLT